MKKYKKAAINIAILTMMLTVGLTNNVLASFNADNTDIDYEQRNQITSQLNAKQEKIINTLEKKDYLSWVKLVGKNNKITKVIDEGSFQKFIEARDAARNGFYDESIKITENLKNNAKKHQFIN